MRSPQILDLNRVFFLQLDKRRVQSLEAQVKCVGWSWAVLKGIADGSVGCSLGQAPLKHAVLVELGQLLKILPNMISSIVSLVVAFNG